MNKEFIVYRDLNNQVTLEFRSAGQVVTIFLEEFTARTLADSLFDIVYGKDVYIGK